MSRQVKEFKNYSDFYAASTPKQSLASLCVHARDILLTYEEYENKIKAELLAEHLSVSDSKAGGAYLTSTIVGGGKEEHKEEAKTEQTSPAAAAPVVINVQQSQENKQQVKQGGGTNTIIKERVIEKPATPATKPEQKDEEPW